MTNTYVVAVRNYNSCGCKFEFVNAWMSQQCENLYCNELFV